jgi:putative membrane protein insertion efficiency factor
VRLLNGLVLFVLTLLVKLYRLTFSKVMPPVCRFHPSCSRYALEALETHGPWKGSWLAVKRLSRCHPFHPGGLDPVPAASTPGGGK